MEAEDRAWRAGAWARTWAKKGARSEPVGKPYGFSGYLLENHTVRRGRAKLGGDFWAFMGISGCHEALGEILGEPLLPYRILAAALAVGLLSTPCPGNRAR